MSNWWVYFIGFTAQILFSSRLFIQWFLSEKSKKIVTPTLFWKLSLLASVLLFLYGYLRDDLAIMLGQALIYFIYIRNLQLQGQWKNVWSGTRFLLWVFPVLILWYGWNNGRYDMENLIHNDHIPGWLLILGIFSQLLFTFRFIYQWIYSEKIHTSHLPIGFWRISVAGASLILLYAIFRKDPVLFLGHTAGLFVYIRNIMIWKKHVRELA